MLELCRRHAIDCEVRDLSLTEIYRAEEMFCTGTMGELASIIAVDGRQIGDGQPGPMTARLSKLYVELTQTEGEAVIS